MKNTKNPFHLGSNVMVEIVDGIVRQIDPATQKLIREIPVTSLNDQQSEAINKARKACEEAAVAQGFKPAGYKNEQ